MGQTESAIDMAQRQVMLHAVLALGKRVDAASDRCHALVQVEIASFPTGWIALPAIGSQDLFNRIYRASYHPVLLPTRR
jgi:hypothetical protein